MVARQRPHAVVDPQLDEAAVGLAVGDDRDRHLHSSGLAIEVENHLLESPCLGDHVVDRIERHVVLREPLIQVGQVSLECPRARDPPVRGSCSTGSPANDLIRASCSPAIKPS